MKEGENCTWTAQLITKIKMVGSWVILIYRQFNKSKPQTICIKINIFLGIASYRGNMMYSKNAFVKIGAVTTLQVHLF